MELVPSLEFSFKFGVWESLNDRGQKLKAIKFSSKHYLNAAHMPSIFSTALTFVLCTYFAVRKSRILFAGFLVKMWLRNAEPLLILFLPTLKRLTALLTLFIFGIFVL